MYDKEALATVVAAALTLAQSGLLDAEHAVQVTLAAARIIEQMR